MARQSQEADQTMASLSEALRREERARRILDAAARLILRWGYHKTTLDDISKEAGVAKGTMYLHWKTREELFAALIKREKVEMAEDIRQRIAVDPAGATLRGMLKHSTLVLMKRPLMKAVLLRDMDMLGKLAQREHSSSVYAERLAGFKTYLELLREQNLVRTDLSLQAEVYILGAIIGGFFLVAPLIPEEFLLADEELAEMLAETVHCTLESARAASADELQSVSRTFMRYLNRDIAIIQEQARQAGLPGAGREEQTQ